jgi:hypothetical protein
MPWVILARSQVGPVRSQSSPSGVLIKSRADRGGVPIKSRWGPGQVPGISANNTIAKVGLSLSSLEPSK